MQPISITKKEYFKLFTKIIIIIIIINLLFSLALQPSAGYGLLVYEVSWSHTTRRHGR
jgi:membrane-anchored glycerophosphoryl diester phosphodiesterase (GDPDase)